MSNKTFFGYQEVKSEQKASLVKDVFSSVAPKYDIMNDFMSIGVHRLWKDSFINRLNPKEGSKLLDVAGGTGDIAFRYLNKSKNGQVTVCDINDSMLYEGKKNAIDNNILNNIDWICGDAENLPVPSNSYDYYTIAFGIRNVTNIDKVLAEAYRALKVGGRFMCLEFSNVQNPLISKLYEFYSFNVIPKVGHLVAGDKESYQYLVESIRKFPRQEEFKGMIQKAGFENVSYTNLTSGVVAIHSGWKL